MAARRIVFAPDSFKSTLTAERVCAALRDGWQEVHPDDEIVMLPMADGGEGTVAAFAHAADASRPVTVTVSRPDGRGHVARQWLKIHRENEVIGVADVASTCGIELIDELIPHQGSTRALGEIVRDMLDKGVDRMVLGIGSSCSTDGGAGFLQALGASLTDENSEPIVPGLEGLHQLCAVDTSNLVEAPDVTVLSDVTNPLCGEQGAARVYGPQKGLTAADMDDADRALLTFAELLGADPNHPGAGAAGGLGMALTVWGAQLVPGATHIASLIGLDNEIAQADVVITGEGKIDSSSRSGKVVGTVIDLVADHPDCRLGLVAGVIDHEVRDHYPAAVSLTDVAGSSDQARAEAARFTREAGRMLAEYFS